MLNQFFKEKEADFGPGFLTKHKLEIDRVIEYMRFLRPDKVDAYGLLAKDIVELKSEYEEFAWLTKRLDSLIAQKKTIGDFLVCPLENEALFLNVLLPDHKDQIIRYRSFETIFVEPSISKIDFQNLILMFMTIDVKIEAAKSAVRPGLDKVRMGVNDLVRYIMIDYHLFDDHDKKGPGFETFIEDAHNDFVSKIGYCDTHVFEGFNIFNTFYYPLKSMDKLKTDFTSVIDFVGNDPRFNWDFYFSNDVYGA